VVKILIAPTSLHRLITEAGDMRAILCSMQGVPHEREATGKRSGGAPDAR
jgi:hypothetical protein